MKKKKCHTVLIEELLDAPIHTHQSLNNLQLLPHITCLHANHHMMAQITDTHHPGQLHVLTSNLCLLNFLFLFFLHSYKNCVK